jgi:hypothetical protein
MLLVALLPVAGVVAGTARAAEDNARLGEIFAADQAARDGGDVDWDVVAERDRAHRVEVLEMLRRGELRTAKDYFHAAMVFQHGATADDYRLAFGLAQLSATLDPDLAPAKWLTAASWDRILMSKKRPQWYGTQYHQPKPGARLALYEVDESAVTDEERTRLGVPPLAKAKAFADEIDEK